MTANGWIQIGLFCLAILVCVKPLGLYMARVFEGERTVLIKRRSHWANR